MLYRHVLLVFILLLVPLRGSADWINLTGAETAPNIAEVSVTEAGVRVVFELYPADRSIFLRKDRFALEVDADGQLLEPEIRVQESRTPKDRFSPFAGMVDPRTQRQIPGPPQDKEVIYLDLFYAFPEGTGLPARITLTPPVDETGMTLASIGFLLDHKTVPVVDFRYLSRAEALVLDWNDPWYSTFENRNLVRHHRWPQMTFLYIEPREVRHESLVRVRDLLVWTGAEAELDQVLAESGQERVRAAAREFFADRNPMTIDGQDVERSAFRAEFLEITPRGLQVVPSELPLDASVALLGVSESYWREGLPETVAVQWELFDERLQQVPTNVVDPAGPYPSFIDPKMPVMSWENFLRDWKEPELRGVRAGNDDWFDLSRIRMAVTGTPGEETAGAVVEALIRQTAIAYLERDPSKQQAALSAVADPNQLSELKPELDRIFAIPTTGGGVASIEALSVPTLEELSAAPDDGGFRALVRWQARAVGRHWGHVDQRRIGFRMLVDVGIREDSWKILGLTVLEAQDVSG